MKRLLETAAVLLLSGVIIGGGGWAIRANAAPEPEQLRLTRALEANTLAVERLERTLGRCRCP